MCICTVVYLDNDFNFATFTLPNNRLAKNWYFTFCCCLNIKFTDIGQISRWVRTEQNCTFCAIFCWYFRKQIKKRFAPPLNGSVPNCNYEFKFCNYGMEQYILVLKVYFFFTCNQKITNILEGYNLVFYGRDGCRNIWNTNVIYA